MTGTFTDPARGRTTWRERAFVLGGLVLALAATIASFASATGADTLGPLWMAAIAWTVLASLAGALRRGFVEGNWSAFRRWHLPDNRQERFDFDTRAGVYAWMRDDEDRHLDDDEHLR